MQGRPAHRRALGWAALIAVWFFWGTTYDAIRLGVRDAPPLLFAGTRYLAAALILLPVAARGRQPGERRFTLANWRSAAIVGALMMFGGNGLVTVGERTLPAGIAALLVATVPLWLVVMDAAVSRRMIRPVVVIGILLGLAGIVVLVHPTASQRLSTGGVVLVLAASASWAAGSLYSRTAPAPRQPFLATSMQMLAGSVVLFVAATVTGEWAQLDPGRLSVGTLLALVWLILPGSVLAFTAYIYSLRALPTATVSTYAYVNPVVAVLIGWPLLGERPTVQTAVAGAIIVAAVALILRAGQRRLPGALAAPAARACPVDLQPAARRPCGHLAALTPHPNENAGAFSPGAPGSSRIAPLFAPPPPCDAPAWIAARDGQDRQDTP